ncbi:hypothetical protein EV645_1920 [Kribbella rubisoli]|uniref:Uncharacterized protein n=1 Tax=Kribbella rubisoli TaxID=3075929 RepID=A0A4Q7X961_9ACTN|nr:hypothetical protein [Kribbella rubisoli]RZU19702.1 hypothetical protein EV645_1920 [Kribbella rubisoli]
MSWQLWVVIALAAAGLVLLAAARMRHARKVFDDITDLNRPILFTPPVTADDLARARARHAHPEPDRHRKHG